MFATGNQEPDLGMLDRGPLTVGDLVLASRRAGVAAIQRALEPFVLVGRVPAGDAAWAFHTRMRMVPNTVALEHAGLSTEMMTWRVKRRGLGAGFSTTVRIGRAPSNDVAVPHSDVSKLHASLVTGRDGRLSLVDEGSTNGTWHNGNRLPPRGSVTLSDGDLIALGPLPPLRLLAAAAMARVVVGDA